MFLADAIRRYRQEQGLSLKELAKMLSVSAPTVEWLERGASVPRLRTFQKIARLFQWTPEEMAVIAKDLPDESPRFCERQPSRDGAQGLQAREPLEQREGWAADRHKRMQHLRTDLGEGAVDPAAQPTG
jgi:transcriptional regulator with XRE-family HTH domain